MAVFTVASQYARSDAWALAALWDPGAGGAGETTITLDASELKQITSVSDALTVSGLSVVYLGSNIARTVKAELFPVPATPTAGMLIALTQYETTENSDFHHFPSLNIPVIAGGSGTVAALVIDAADAGDLCYLMCWGTYPEKPSTIPVDVKSFRQRPPPVNKEAI